MGTVIKIILTAIAGYLCGSFSTAVLLIKHTKGEDVRTKGSKNAGATNVARVYGMKMGLITLFGDMIKTAIPSILGHFLLGDLGVAIACAAVLIGHCWPVFFGFKGGKGVSAAACVALFIDWRLFLILLALFFITFAITKTVSVCSILAAIEYSIVFILLNGFTAPYVYLTLFITFLVPFMHRENIKRIFKGEEKKFKPNSVD